MRYLFILLLFAVAHATAQQSFQVGIEGHAGFGIIRGGTRNCEGGTFNGYRGAAIQGQYELTPIVYLSSGLDVWKGDQYTCIRARPSGYSSDYNDLEMQLSYLSLPLGVMLRTSKNRHPATFEIGFSPSFLIQANGSNLVFRDSLWKYAAGTDRRKESKDFLLRYYSGCYYNSETSRGWILSLGVRYSQFIGTVFLPNEVGDNYSGGSMGVVEPVFRISRRIHKRNPPQGAENALGAEP